MSLTVFGGVPTLFGLAQAHLVQLTGPHVQTHSLQKLPVALCWKHALYSATQAPAGFRTGLLAWV